MSVMQRIKTKDATIEDALKLFDSLDPVSVDFMLGEWVGEGYHTGHELDGLLETCRWHGKRFHSSENVDPLVFRTLGGDLVAVNPLLLAPAMALPGRVPVPRSAVAGRAFQLALPLLKTRRSRARLRMVQYRGKTSATMIYDQLPINDVFRRIDENTVLGLMDMKAMNSPFFFLLRRENA